MKSYIHDGIRILYNTEAPFRFNMKASHFHDEYEIYYLTSGSRHLYINDNIYPLSAGSLALIDGEKMHRTFSPDNAPYTRFIVCVNKHLLQERFPKLKEPFSKDTVISLTSAQQIQMNRLTDMLKYDIENDLPLRHEAISAVADKLIIDAARFFAEQTAAINSMNSTTVKVIDYINAHYSEKLTLPLIAQNCYISVSHLTRLFKATTGYTVITYINSLRIKKASEMLKSTSMSVSETASKTGFESLSYFVKMFSVYFGMSPLQYRKLNRDL